MNYSQVGIFVLYLYQQHSLPPIKLHGRIVVHPWIELLCDNTTDIVAVVDKKRYFLIRNVDKLLNGSHENVPFLFPLQGSDRSSVPGIHLFELTALSGWKI